MGSFVERNDMFSNIKQEVLPRISFNHTPSVLQCGKWEHTKSYSKFESWWLETEFFSDRVKIVDIFCCRRKVKLYLAAELKLWKGN